MLPQEPARARRRDAKWRLSVGVASDAVRKKESNNTEEKLHGNLSPLRVPATLQTSLLVENFDKKCKALVTCFVP